MKVAVIGSRGFNDYFLLSKILKEIPGIEQIISGGAVGADSLAAKWAKENKVDLIEHIPDYKKYGRSAPIVRNRTIVDQCDAIVAFWDGESRGAAYTIKYGENKDKVIKKILYRTKSQLDG